MTPQQAPGRYTRWGPRHLARGDPAVDRSALMVPGVGRWQSGRPGRTFQHKDSLAGSYPQRSIIHFHVTQSDGSQLVAVCICRPAVRPESGQQPTRLHRGYASRLRSPSSRPRSCLTSASWAFTASVRAATVATSWPTICSTPTTSLPDLTLEVAWRSEPPSVSYASSAAHSPACPNSLGRDSLWQTQPAASSGQRR